MRETLVKSEEFKNSLWGEIPKDWEFVRLFEVSELITKGATPTTYGHDFVESGIAFIRGMNATQTGDINTTAIKYISREAEKIIFRSRLQQDDILLSIVGTMSIFLVVPEFILPANINQNVALVRLKQGCIAPSYIKQFLQSESFYAQLQRENTVQAQPSLSLEQVGQFKILVPPINEQRRIAEILDTIDEAIARTSSLIAKLKQMKAGLLHDLLTRGLDENGELRDATKHPEHFKDSILGRIPKEWQTMRLGEACSLLKDGTHLPPKRVENGVLLLSVQNMIDGRLELTNSDTKVSWDFYRTMHKNWEIQVGDLLLAIVGATIGKTAVVPPMPPFTLQRSVAVFRGKLETLENSFLHLYIASEKFQGVIWHRVNQTAQPGIYLAELAAFYIPLPSPKEQRDIATIIDAHNTHIRTEEAYRDKLKLQKQGLMQDLLTGRVRAEVKNFK